MGNVSSQEQAVVGREGRKGTKEIARMASPLLLRRLLIAAAVATTTATYPFHVLLFTYTYTYTHARIQVRSHMLHVFMHTFPPLFSSCIRERDKNKSDDGDLRSERKVEK